MVDDSSYLSSSFTVAQDYKDLSSSFGVYPMPNPPVMWRKGHTIDGSSAGEQTDYQVQITAKYSYGDDSGDTVYLNERCRTDFDDVYFMDEDRSVNLDFWRESKTDGVEANFWVKVPLIPASPDKVKIYIYYGDQTKTPSDSNFSNTVTELASFESDWDGWTAESDLTNGTVTRDTTNPYSGSYAVRIRSVEGYTPQYARIYRSFAGGRRIFYWCDWHGTLSDYKSGSHWIDGVRTEDFRDNGTDPPYTRYSFTWTGSAEIKIGQQVIANFTSYTTNWDYDYIYTFKYVSPEPSHGAWDAEVSVYDGLSTSVTVRNIASDDLSSSVFVYQIGSKGLISSIHIPSARLPSSFSIQRASSKYLSSSFYVTLPGSSDLSSSFFSQQTTPILRFRTSGGVLLGEAVNLDTAWIGDVSRDEVKTVEIFFDNVTISDQMPVWDLFNVVVSIVSISQIGEDFETVDATKLSLDGSPPWTNTITIPSIPADGPTNPPTQSFWLQYTAPALAGFTKKQWTLQFDGKWYRNAAALPRGSVSLSSSFHVQAAQLSSSVTILNKASAQVSSMFGVSRYADLSSSFYIPSAQLPSSIFIYKFSSVDLSSAFGVSRFANLSSSFAIAHARLSSSFRVENAKGSAYLSSSFYVATYKNLSSSLTVMKPDSAYLSSSFQIPPWGFADLLSNIILDYVDLEDFNEYGTSGDLTVVGQRVDFDTMRRDSDDYLQRNYGSGAFVDFIYQFAFSVTALEAGDATSQDANTVLAFSNVSGPYDDIEEQSIIYVNIRQNGSVDDQHRVRLGINESGIVRDTDDSAVYGLVTWYCTLNRVKSGTTTLELYSDPQRTALVDTLSITDRNMEFGYLSVAMGHERVTDPSDNVSGWVAHLRRIYEDSKNLSSSFSIGDSKGLSSSFTVNVP